MAEQPSKNDVTICGLLGIAFVVLKLTDQIDWSWWWVTAPFWGPHGLLLLIGLVGMVWALWKVRKVKKHGTQQP